MFFTIEFGALAVLYDFFEIAAQHASNFRDFASQLTIQASAVECLAQLVNELNRDAGEIVDEIERVLDLVGDPGGQLAQGGELLGLDQAVLRDTQLLE